MRAMALYTRFQDEKLGIFAAFTMLSMHVNSIVNDTLNVHCLLPAEVDPVDKMKPAFHTTWAGIPER